MNQPLQSRERHWWTRNIVLVGLSAIPVILVFRWAAYRLEHTVSSDATVKGNVAVVGSRLDGRLASVAVQANQFLRAGDVIAKLEDDDLHAALAEARIEKSRAEKQLEMEQALLRQERLELEIQLSQAEAEIEVAQANLESAQQLTANARRKQDRVRNLTLPTAVSEHEKDAILLGLQQAEVGTTSARALLQAKQLERDVTNAKLQGTHVRQQGLAVLRRNIELAQARIDRVEASLEATVIRSPIDGWVGSRIAGAGTSVRLGDPIVSVLEDERLWLEAWVAESRLGQLEVGRHVDVRLKAHPDTPLTGIVEAIGVLSNHEQVRQLDATVLRPQASNKVGVRISIRHEGLRLMPGLSAVVGIQSHESRHIPILAKIRSAMIPLASWFRHM